MPISRRVRFTGSRPRVPGSLWATSSQAAVAKGLTRHRVGQLRPRVRDIADALLDDLHGHDEVDLLSAYCAPLPITVICELLGVHTADRRDFRSWTDSLPRPRPRNTRVTR